MKYCGCVTIMGSSISTIIYFYVSILDKRAPRSSALYYGALFLQKRDFIWICLTQSEMASNPRDRKRRATLSWEGRLQFRDLEFTERTA